MQAKKVEKEKSTYRTIRTRGHLKIVKAETLKAPRRGWGHRDKGEIKENAKEYHFFN